MAQSTPSGITPPAPGLDREEPDFWLEDDIPSDDGSSRPESSGAREDRSHHKPERE
jgi:hypothetical protein